LKCFNNDVCSKQRRCIGVIPSRKAFILALSISGETYVSINQRFTTLMLATAQSSVKEKYQRNRVMSNGDTKHIASVRYT